MLGFQTISCLHDIPVIRSSTNKLQDVYAKAKETSFLVRLPCNIAETVVDTSLKVVQSVANPLVKPLSGPVRCIDNYAAQKIRQMESKYPVINTPTEDVVNTLNEKAEPVRNVMNSVKDTTTSTIQHGKETVSHVATATVNKASGVADSVFSFCGSGKQGTHSYQSRGLTTFACSTIASLWNCSIQLIATSLLWFRMLLIFILLKSKQINDLLLNKMQRVPIVLALPQRVLILFGTILDSLVSFVRPDDRTLSQLKKPRQQSRYNPQGQLFNNIPGLRPDPATRVRQSNVANKSEPLHVRSSPASQRQESNGNRQTNGHVIGSSQSRDYSNLTDAEQLHARLADSNPRQSMSDDDQSFDETDDHVVNHDIAELHNRINATDIELLYSRLPGDVLPNADEQDALNPDQQDLQTRVFGRD